jgi:hypothetical protein
VLHRFERGQALIDFSLAIPIALLAVLAIFDFGRALYTYDLVTSAARIGTRYAIVHGSACGLPAPACPADQSTIKTYILSKINGIDPTQLTVVANWYPGPGCNAWPYQGPRCLVNVQVSYPYTFIVNTTWSMNLSSSSQMPISQ